MSIPQDESRTHDRRPILLQGSDRTHAESAPTRIAAYLDGNVMRVIAIVYAVDVDDSESLRVSDESLALRFFTRDELPGVDLVETACPVVDAYLTQQPIVLA